MNYAVLEDNVVINIAVADEESALQFGWIPVSANCVIGSTYDGTEFHLPPPPPEPDYTDYNKQQAKELLVSTDWVTLTDVSDANVTPHLLNTNEFLNYRVEIRNIAVNTPNTRIDIWPTRPTEEWSS